MPLKWHTTNENFINPYQFVSLSGKVIRDKVVFKNEITGVIHCTLTTKTSLALPDHSINLNKTGTHPYFPFFSINEIPVIPGSELRGVVRSAFEAVIPSCLSVSNASNILSARNPTPRKPGVVQFIDGQWRLYEADARKVDSLPETLQQNEVVRKWYNKNGTRTLWIFTKKFSKVICSDLEKSIQDFKYVMHLYEKFDKKANHLPDLSYSLENDGKFYPVYYQFGFKKDVYLSPAAISRSVFHKRLDDLIGDHKKCTCREDACPACRLFGMVGDESALSGRVRFSDAYPQKKLKKKDFQENVHLKELSSPKTSAMEFYTLRPEGAQTWNYDYATIRPIDKSLPIRKKGNISIRGRKFYFHHTGSPISHEGKSERDCTTDLLKANEDFSFEIYLDRVNIKELKQLLWVLTIGDNTPDSLLQHKMGFGKPLGLGSVKITVDCVDQRKFENSRYIIDQNYDFENAILEAQIDTSSQSVKEFLKIANIRTVAANKVRYPIANKTDEKKPANATASYQWFIGNRQMGNKATGIKQNIGFVLPKLLEDNLTLPALKYSENDLATPGRSNAKNTGRN